MTPTKPGDYAFDAKTLIDLRTKLKLSQTEMARQLGVPPNTLHRWETAATTPDASSLASIFSLAVGHGIRPNFFVRRAPVTEKTKGRHKLIVMWDFQNIGASATYVSELSKYIRDSLLSKFSSTKQHLFKAFSHPDQTDATDVLSELGWRVWEDDDDMDEEIVDQSRSDCGAEPEATILVLITKDGDYSDVIDELKAKGVRVYLMAPKDAHSGLVETVGRKRWIMLDPPTTKGIASQNRMAAQPRSAQVYYPAQNLYDDDDD